MMASRAPGLAVRVETLVEGCRLRDVVIDVSQEQRFTTLVRKIGRGGGVLDHRDIGQPFLLGVGSGRVYATDITQRSELSHA
jgi:hypothetical protein